MVPPCVEEVADFLRGLEVGHQQVTNSVEYLKRFNLIKERLCSRTNSLAQKRTVFSMLTDLISELSLRLRERSGGEEAVSSSILDILSSLVDLLSQYRHLSPSVYELERAQLSLVKTSLKVGKYSCSFRFLSSLLERLNESVSESGVSQDTKQRQLEHSKLSIGFWLSYFLTATEINDQHKFAHMLKNIENSVDIIKHYFCQIPSTAQHRSIAYQYLMRIIERAASMQAAGHMHAQERNPALVHFFNLVITLCDGSDLSADLPSTVKHLAKILSLADLCTVISSFSSTTLASYSSAQWLEVFESIALHACSRDEETSTFHKILVVRRHLLQDHYDHYCDVIAQLILINVSFVKLEVLELQHCLSQFCGLLRSLKTPSHDILAVTKYWRWIHKVAVQFYSDTKKLSVLSRETIQHLLEWDLVLMKQATVLLPGACNDVRVKEHAEKSVHILAVLYVRLLWFKVDESQDLRDEIFNNLHLVYEHMCLRNQLQISNSIQKLALTSDENNSQSIMLMDACQELCVHAARVHDSIQHYDELSKRLMVYADFCIAKDVANQALSKCTEAICRFQTSLHLKTIYIYEAIRLLRLQGSIGNVDFIQQMEKGYERMDEFVIIYLSAWCETLKLSTSMEDECDIENWILFSIQSACKYMSTSCTLTTLLETLLQTLESKTIRMESQMSNFTIDHVKHCAVVFEELKTHGSVVPREPIHTIRQIQIACKVISLSLSGIVNSSSLEPFADIKGLIDEVLSNMAQSLVDVDVSAKTPASINDLSSELTQTFISIEKVHAKLCIFDYTNEAELLAEGVRSLTGIGLVTMSTSSEVFLVSDVKIYFPKSYITTQSNIRGCKYTASVFHTFVLSEFSALQILSSTGEWQKAYIRVKGIVELLEKTLRTRQRVQVNDHDELHETICFGGTHAQFQLSLWRLLSLYLVAMSMKAKLSSHLGLVCDCNAVLLEMEDIAIKSQLSNILAVSKLIRTSSIIFSGLNDSGLKINIHLDNVTLDERASTCLQKACQLCNLAVSALGETVDSTCSFDHSFMEQLSLILLSVLPLPSALVIDEIRAQPTRSLIIDEGTGWVTWFRLFANSCNLRYSLYSGLTAFDRTCFLRAATWIRELTESKRVPAFHIMHSLYVESTMNIAHMHALAGSVERDEQAFVELCTNTFNLLERALVLAVASPLYRSTVLRLYGALMTVMRNPIDSRAIQRIAYSTCGPATALEIGSVTYGNLADSSEYMTLKYFPSKDSQSYIESTLSVLEKYLYTCPIKFPVTTICDDFWNHAQDSEGGKTRKVLMTRQSPLSYERPIIVTLPWSSTTDCSTTGVLQPTEALRYVLSQAPDCPTKGDLNDRHTKVRWWEHRILQDDGIQAVVRSMERNLGCWSILLADEPHDRVIEQAEQMSRDILDELVKCIENTALCIRDFSSHLLRLLIQNLQSMDDNQIESVFCAMMYTSDDVLALEKKNAFQAFSKAALSYFVALCRQKAGLLLKTMADVVATEHTPILLLPDVSYNELPWESLSCSRGYNIYRLPNALSLNDKYLKDKSTRHISVDVANSFALLNPNGDLVGTEKALRPVLDKYRWHVVCGQPPTDLRAMLREYNLFLFFGHGAAIDFLGHLKFRTSLWRSTMILMGCSSGALRHSIDSPSDIPVVCYLVAGSPAILANLWDVTDAEIDRFSLSLLNSWSCRVEKTQMIEFDMSASVRESRTSCRLPYLTGGAPVVYGLPVHFLPIN